VGFVKEEGGGITRVPLTFPSDFPRLTHYIFRYPAKFHPPVVRALLERYSRPGDTVFDPFCGSGTLLVEALKARRRAIGSDIDPLAIAVAQAKVTPLEAKARRKAIDHVLDLFALYERTPAAYDELMWRDFTDDEFNAEQIDCWHEIPDLPRIEHWFRRYVICDLANIRRALAEVDCRPDVRHFLHIVFGSIIRNASNADPVPVSGLEVTAHMRRLELEGRRINPFDLMRNALRRADQAITELVEKLPTASSTAKVFTADATRLPKSIGIVDAVITSPPYHNAVDYYRRHLLEMYWLGLVATTDDRLALLPRYIGRHRVPISHPLLQEWTSLGELTDHWAEAIGAKNPERGRDFRHYALSMRRTFHQLAPLLRRGAPAVFVVGHSTWDGNEIPTVDLFEELAGDTMSVSEVLSYPVKNRYMSYARHNGASIDQEYVVILRRR
jgi:SAM-dependent methyltransferase